MMAADAVAVAAATAAAAVGTRHEVALSLFPKLHAPLEPKLTIFSGIYNKSKSPKKSHKPA